MIACIRVKLAPPSDQRMHRISKSEECLDAVHQALGHFGIGAESTSHIEHSSYFLHHSKKLLDVALFLDSAEHHTADKPATAVGVGSGHPGVGKQHPCRQFLTKLL